MNRFRTMGLTSALLVGVVSGIVILGAYISFGFSANPSGVGTSPSDMPPMTMIYEVDGDSYKVGDRSIPVYKELRRLEYVSKTNWIDTVIESPSVDLGRYGTRSAVGSYTRLEGNTITEFDAIDGTTEVDTVASDAVFLPARAFSYGLLSRNLFDTDPDIARSAVPSEASACVNGECEAEAPALRYTGNGVDVVILDVESESWMIPLKLGDEFLVKSIDIQSATSGGATD